MEEKLEHGVGELIPPPGARGRRGLAAAIDGNGADTQELPVGRRRRQSSENPPGILKR